MDSLQHDVTAGPKNILILGAGGFAREVAALVDNINDAHPGTWNTIGYLERGDERRGEIMAGAPILNFADLDRFKTDIYAVAGIGNPKTKELALKDAEKLGCKFATLVHPSVVLAYRKTLVIGQGSIICAGCIIAIGASIGSHVILNFDCSIGHDTIIEDYVTLSPGCHLSGFNVLRRSCFLGTGAVTIEHLEIGARSVIGAGAAVVRDIPEDVTAVGVPAKYKI